MLAMTEQEIKHLKEISRMFHYEAIKANRNKDFPFRNALRLVRDLIDGALL